MVLTDENINIKGTADGLLISFKGSNWKEMQTRLFEKIEINSSFFTKAKLALEVGETGIKAAEMGKLRDQLSQKGIILWAILSTSDTTINAAQLLGISTHLGLKKASNDKRNSPSTFEGEAAVWVEKTLRAGYRIETKSHVMLMGDLNPGAEIVSGGNVFIFGRANGAIHAGAEGDRSAKVYALELKPTQLKIADVTATPFTGKIKSQPETAFIEGEQITIKSWTSRKPI
jgi:septum site-determining protein MinC